MKGSTKIKVVGIGGSGGNAIFRMKRFGIKGVELIAMNTDYQDLKKIKADVKLKMGGQITQGLGTGMNPKKGEAAAKQSKGEIKKVLSGADMVFITGGLGGGTGSGAAPVVAKIARNLGALTIAIVTLPFSFEGSYRKNIAEESRDSLKKEVDALVVIKNDRLIQVLNPNTSLLNAFWVCDDILREAVKGISDLILLPGIVNVDFADVRSILKGSGTALFGIGTSMGERRAEDAVKLALTSPLLGVTPKGARGVLFNVSGEDVSLSEIEEVGSMITEEINPRAKVIFGAVQNEKLRKGEIKVTVVATGF